MGADPVTMMAVSAAGKMAAGAFGGGAQAAPAAGAAPVNAFTAGLVGQGQQPPMPERNPAFHDPVGDASGKAILDESPLAKKAMEAIIQDEKKPATIPGAPEGMAAANMFKPQAGPAGSFDANPWTTETVQGSKVNQAAAKSGERVRIDLSQPQPVAKDQARVGPVQAATDTAQPAPTTRPKPAQAQTAARPNAFAPPQSPPMAPVTPPPQPPAPPALPAGQGPVSPFLAAPKPAAPAAPAETPATPGGGVPMPNMFGLNEGLTGLNKWMKGVPTNPMAQVGMSLLASGYDGSNPWTGMQTSLGNIPRLEMALQQGRIAQAAADRAERAEGRTEAKEAQEQALAASLAAILGEYSKPEYEGTSRVARGAAKVIR